MGDPSAVALYEVGHHLVATIRKRGAKWHVQVRKTGAASQSRTFPTKAAARRWATRLESEIDAGRASGGTVATGTLAELIERYEREIDPISRFGRTKASSLRLLKQELGTSRLRDLTAHRLIGWGRDRHANGAGPVTIAVDLSYLGTVLRTARALWRLSIDDRAITEARDALRMVGLVDRSRRRERRPTPMEIERLCLLWRSNPRQLIPMADLIEFAIASGHAPGRDLLDPLARPGCDRAHGDHPRPQSTRGGNRGTTRSCRCSTSRATMRWRSSRGSRRARDGRIFPYKAQSVSTRCLRARATR